MSAGMATTRLDHTDRHAWHPERLGRKGAYRISWTLESSSVTPVRRTTQIMWLVFTLPPALYHMKIKSQQVYDQWACNPELRPS